MWVVISLQAHGGKVLQCEHELPPNTIVIASKDEGYNEEKFHELKQSIFDAEVLISLVYSPQCSIGHPLDLSHINDYVLSPTSDGKLQGNVKAEQSKPKIPVTNQEPQDAVLPKQPLSKVAGNENRAELELGVQSSETNQNQAMDISQPNLVIDKENCIQDGGDNGVTPKTSPERTQNQPSVTAHQGKPEGVNPVDNDPSSEESTCTVDACIGEKQDEANGPSTSCGTENSQMTSGQEEQRSSGTEPKRETADETVTEQKHSSQVNICPSGKTSIVKPDKSTQEIEMVNLSHLTDFYNGKRKVVEGQEINPAPPQEDVLYTEFLGKSFNCQM